MAVRAMLLILAVFHLANGAWMLAAPQDWYAAIPGVRETGPLNHHFVADIGLAFIASGTGLALGALRRAWAPVAAMAGATWPALHALLHVWDWLAHGFPATAPEAVSEAVGVVAAGLLGVLAAWMRSRQIGGTRC